MRELVRQIQDMRKQAGLTRNDRIGLHLITKHQLLITIFAEWQDFIYKETLAQKYEDGQAGNFDLEKEIELGGEKVKTMIRKIK